MNYIKLWPPPLWLHANWYRPTISRCNGRRSHRSQNLANNAASKSQKLCRLPRDHCRQQNLGVFRGRPLCHRSQKKFFLTYPPSKSQKLADYPPLEKLGLAPPLIECPGTPLHASVYILWPPLYNRNPNSAAWTRMWAAWSLFREHVRYGRARVVGWIICIFIITRTLYHILTPYSTKPMC